ncbi:MAG: signal peptidase II [Myxococcota bacterium]
MSEVRTSEPRPLPRLVGAAATWAFLLWADLHTKEIARDILPQHPGIPVIDGFWNWKYAENRDVGFSLLRVIPEDMRQYVIYGMVSLGILAVLVYGLRRWQSLLALAGATLVLSGAIGNLTDRVLRGFVTDFIQWYYGSFYWPVFNLADVYVVVGVGLLMIYEWRLGASTVQEAQTA